MKNMYFKCTYCGVQFIEKIENLYAELEFLRCPKCGEKNVEPIRYEKVDYYSDRPQEDAYIKRSRK